MLTVNSGYAPQIDTITFSQTKRTLCQATHLSVLVHSLCDPLGVWVASDGLVEGVNQNHLKEFVGGVLTHPVGVKHSQCSTMTASTLLGYTNMKVMSE
uniref:Uncharacterized protein n=1 Tax=Monopterus albus TaxID=43700 RepID=A0A3Q3J0I0_MONAL